MESMQQRRDRWERAVAEWQASGLSGAAWCRQNNVNYLQFLYWKDRFPAKAPEFVEVDDRQEKSGLVLECNGVQLHLENDFNEALLARVISILCKLC